MTMTVGDKKVIQDGIKVTNNFHSMRINFGKYKLSISESGMSASAGVPNDLFKLWVKAMKFDNDALKQIGMTKKNPVIGEIVEQFAKSIPMLWKGWNQ